MLAACGGSVAALGSLDGAIGPIEAGAVDSSTDAGAPQPDARASWDGACGAGFGSWPMAAHDPRRTARSDGNGPRTNHIRWRYPTVNFGSSPAVSSDGTVYFTEQGGPGALAALRPDGTRKWSLPGVGPYASPSIGADGTVYVEGDGVYDPNQFKFPADILIAVDPNGMRKWSVPDFARINMTDAPPVPGPGGVMFVARQGVYGVLPNGTEVFHLGKSGGGPSQPNGDSASRRIAIGAGVAIASIGNLDTAEAGTFAITTDGSTTWTLPGSYEGLVGADGNFYGLGPTGVDAISPAGVALWHFDLVARTTLAEGPTGDLFLRTRDGVVRINPKTHVPQLVYPLHDDSMAWPSTLVMDASGYLYFYFQGSKGPEVIVLDPSGALAFTIDLSDPDGGTFGDYIDATSLALGDCVLYVGAFTHLVAVGL